VLLVNVNRMPRSRLPRAMKQYSPTGRRNHGRPLKRLLDAWDRNGSTSGPTPWKIDDDDDDVLLVHIFLYLDKCNIMIPFWFILYFLLPFL